MNFQKIRDKIPEQDDLILYFDVSELPVIVKAGSGRVKWRWVEYSTAGNYRQKNSLPYVEGELVKVSEFEDTYYKLRAMVDNEIIEADYVWISISEFTSSLLNKPELVFTYRLIRDERPKEGSEIIAIISTNGGQVHKRGTVYYRWQLFEFGQMAKTCVDCGGFDPNTTLLDQNAEYRLVGRINDYVLYDNVPWMCAQTFDEILK